MVITYSLSPALRITLQTPRIAQLSFFVFCSWQRKSVWRLREGLSITRWREGNTSRLYLVSLSLRRIVLVFSTCPVLVSHAHAPARPFFLCLRLCTLFHTFVRSEVLFLPRFIEFARQT